MLKARQKWRAFFLPQAIAPLGVNDVHRLVDNFDQTG